MNSKLPANVFIISIIIILLISIFGVIYYKFQLRRDVKPQALLQNLKPVTAARVGLSFSLSSPEDNRMVFVPDLLVQGKTTPEANVILSQENIDQQLSISASGDFSSIIKLQAGLNTILVTAFDSQGNTKSERRVVYYSTEKI